jgi:hypothetical protein
LILVRNGALLHLASRFCPVFNPGIASKRRSQNRVFSKRRRQDRHRRLSVRARDIRPSPRRRDAASARRSVFVERKCDLHARSQPPRCDAAGLSKRHMMCGNYWAEHGYLACCRTVLGPAAMPKVLAATPMTTPRRRQREHAASARRPRARSIICVPQRCRSQSHLPAGLVQWRQHHAQRDGLPGPRRHGLSRRARILSRLRSGMVARPFAVDLIPSHHVSRLRGRGCPAKILH